MILTPFALYNLSSQCYVSTISISRFHNKLSLISISTHQMQSAITMFTIISKFPNIFSPCTIIYIIVITLQYYLDSYNHIGCIVDYHYIIYHLPGIYHQPIPHHMLVVHLHNRVHLYLICQDTFTMHSIVPPFPIIISTITIIYSTTTFPNSIHFITYIFLTILQCLSNILCCTEISSTHQLIHFINII